MVFSGARQTPRFCSLYGNSGCSLDPALIGASSRLKGSKGLDVLSGVSEEPHRYISRIKSTSPPKECNLLLGLHGYYRFRCVRTPMPKYGAAIYDPVCYPVTTSTTVSPVSSPASLATLSGNDPVTLPSFPSSSSLIPPLGCFRCETH